MSAIAYESIVSQLQTMGFSPEKAQAAAREVHPELAAAMDRNATRRADVSEKAEQAIIVKMARAIGMTAGSTSQARASKVMPGLPDLILTYRARGFFGFWEAKRQLGGERSSAQISFAEDCLAANIAYGFGDRYAFAEFLASHGFTPPTIPA